MKKQPCSEISAFKNSDPGSQLENSLEKIDQYQRSTEKKDEKLTEILMWLPELYLEK